MSNVATSSANLHFMLKLTATTSVAAGTVIANLGLLKAIHSFSGMALAGISYVQGMGVRSNEQKDGTDGKETVGTKLMERGYKIISNEIRDLPKIALVTLTGIAAMIAGNLAGGGSLAGLVESIRLPS